MPILAKPYTVSWPLTAETTEDLDRMVQELYDEMVRLSAATGSSTASGGMTPAQTSARVIPGL